MNEDKFKKIDDLNKTLENIYVLASNTLSNFDVDDMSLNMAQPLVDNLCRRVSASLNYKLNILRVDLIKNLHNGFISSNEIIEQLKPLVEFDLNIDTVVDAVRQIITILSGPYQKAIEYTTELTPKIVELSNNIANLSTLQDSIPKPPEMPSLSFNKLRVQMLPITLDEIISGVPLEPEFDTDSDIDTDIDTEPDTDTDTNTDTDTDKVKIIFTRNSSKDVIGGYSLKYILRYIRTPILYDSNLSSLTLNLAEIINGEEQAGSEYTVSATFDDTLPDTDRLFDFGNIIKPNKTYKVTFTGYIGDCMEPIFYDENGVTEGMPETPLYKPANLLAYTETIYGNKDTTRYFVGAWSPI